MKWWQRHREKKLLKLAVRHHKHTVQLMEERLRKMQGLAKPEAVAEQQSRISRERALQREAENRLAAFERQVG
jgi:hypothetical protein